MKRFDSLTIRHAQVHQPWVIPYSANVLQAEETTSPNILSQHAVLHAMKSVGKLAALFEAVDHRDSPNLNYNDLALLQSMSADLMTVALRLANLHGFDLAEVLCMRIRDKNGVDLPVWNNNNHG